ncbi:hypothetical protein BC827DRAFT_1219435 [Russula dissimulans]|nr:hypothetical protein BC827DRAFT_1219435 [Russula dissimulans]
MIYSVEFICLRSRVESMNINNIESEFSWETGFISVIPAPRLPRRVVLTAECYHGGRAPDNTFAFTVDVLLVPTSFNMETCFHLYLGPRQKGYEGIRRLRDDIILLRRIAAHGMDVGVAAEQCDIPEDIQNRTDYRLVVTCPVLYFTSPSEGPAEEGSTEEESAEEPSGPSGDGFFILLEMEFGA